MAGARHHLQNVLPLNGLLHTRKQRYPFGKQRYPDSVNFSNSIERQFLDERHTLQFRSEYLYICDSVKTLLYSYSSHRCLYSTSSIMIYMEQKLVTSDFYLVSLFSLADLQETGVPAVPRQTEVHCICMQETGSRPYHVKLKYMACKRQGPGRTT